MENNLKYYLKDYFVCTQATKDPREMLKLSTSQVRPCIPNFKPNIRVGF